MLEEIKQKMHEVIDRAWEALHGTHDVDEARKVAQAATAELQGQVLAVEAQLVNHVADNAKAAVEKAPTETGETGETGGAETPTETGKTPDPATADKPAAASGKKTSK